MLESFGSGGDSSLLRPVPGVIYYCVIEQLIEFGTVQPFPTYENRIDLVHIRDICQRISIQQDQSNGELAMKKVRVGPFDDSDGESDIVTSIYCPALNTKSCGFLKPKCHCALGNFDLIGWFDKCSSSVVIVVSAPSLQSLYSSDSKESPCYFSADLNPRIPSLGPLPKSASFLGPNTNTAIPRMSSKCLG
jgi:hypothetical protein